MKIKIYNVINTPFGFPKITFPKDTFTKNKETFSSSKISSAKTESKIGKIKVRRERGKIRYDINGTKNKLYKILKKFSS